MSEVPARLSKGDSRSWEVVLDSITLADGELLITDGDKTKVLKSDQTYHPKTADLSVYAIDHSNFSVVRNDG